jgi:8-oxo-dGTP pyrophosphatase MutT (NUDIX family)
LAGTVTKPCEGAAAEAEIALLGDGIGMNTQVFSAANLHRDSIRAALRPTPPDSALFAPPLRPAAVLVPVIERPEPTLLFTRRTEHLPSHAGQISFPGGRFHAGDASLTQTALRETEEEIGVAPAAIDLAGFLDAYETLNSGFMILPVVGFLKPDYVLSPNESEVAEVFEAPLDFLIAPKNHGLRRLERGGVMREFFAIEYRGHTIWGATAAMIVNLSERLRG